MNNLLMLVAVSIGFNMSNFTGFGVFNYAIMPFTDIIGDFFFVFLALSFIVYSYLQGDKNSFITLIVMIIFLALFMFILPTYIKIVIFLLAAIIIGWIFYYAFARKRDG